MDCPPVTADNVLVKHSPAIVHQEGIVFRRQLRFFRVVRSEEDKYAVWPANAEHLSGWQETGYFGSEEECHQYVEKREQSQSFLVWRH
jgi:uncharacterized protein YbdZ (MbtH family)